MRATGAKTKREVVELGLAALVRPKEQEEYPGIARQASVDRSPERNAAKRMTLADSVPMEFDYDTLDHLRQHHPAWRLLRSDHAPLIASFLHRAFIAPNQRVLAQSDLAEALEDELFALRERLGPGAFPRAALDYLNDWAGAERGGSASSTGTIPTSPSST